MISTKLALAVALLTVGVFASLVPASAAAERRLVVPTNPFPDTRYPAPSKDKFYAAPSNLSAYKEGDIIREREITKDLLPGVDSSVVGHAYQLLYKTQTAFGNPDVTVTVVLKPKVPVAGPIAKILSLAFFVDAPVYDCANSWGLIANTNSNQSITTLIQTPYINSGESLLKNGYYVTVPDFQGTQAAFIAGYGSGRGQLDGTRAILRHEKTIASPAGHEIIFAGYSGGAHAAAWASQLSVEYAPELNIIGATIGGTPVDLKSVLINLNKNPFSAVAIAALAGVANAYPEFKEWLLRTVNKKGKEVFNAINTDQKCLLQFSAKYAFLAYFDWVPDGEASFNEPIPKRYIELNRLGARGKKDLITKFPMMIYHSTKDKLILEPPVSAYVDVQCAGGASIDYSTSAVVDHISQGIIGIPASLAWIAKRFNGTLVQKGCTRTTHGILDAFDPAFDRNAGTKAAEQTRDNLKFKFFQ